MNAVAEQILAASDRLSERLAALPPVGDLTALDPTRYCRSAWAAYLRMAARPGCCLIVGMNPGPHGMAQTGVPFTDPHTLRDLAPSMPILVRPTPPPKVGAWSFAGLQRFDVIESTTQAAAKIHGIDIRPPRREESAKRLWGLLREICAPYCAEGPSADKVAEATRRACRGVLLVNALPICWLDPAGKNVSAEKVVGAGPSVLPALAGEWLDAVVDATRPAAVVGVGRWAQALADHAWAGMVEQTGTNIIGNDGQVKTNGLFRIKHPSPLAGSEQAWRAEAEPVLRRAIDLARHSRCVAEVEREERLQVLRAHYGYSDLDMVDIASGARADDGDYQGERLWPSPPAAEWLILLGRGDLIR